jgi:hypothetical protein
MRRSKEVKQAKSQAKLQARMDTNGADPALFSIRRPPFLDALADPGLVRI